MYITFWYQVIAECCVTKISYSENTTGNVWKFLKISRLIKIVIEY